VTEVRDDASEVPARRWEVIQDQVRKRRMMEAAMGGPAITVPTLDRFELLEYLGSGGMGAVFKAYDPKLRRVVAVKVCKFEDDSAAATIEHEARCLAQVVHPNVAVAYDVVRTQTDVLLVMEFVQGQTLRVWQRETHPPWNEVLTKIVAAGYGLAAVHAAGLEHGDFKPDNVLIGDDGRARVVDFGIARYLAGPVADDDFEVKALGTIPYTAPERLTGRPSDARADLFSFSVSAWESFYGTRPYEGTTPNKLLDSMESGILATDPERQLPGVPKAMRPILAAGVSPRVEDRPPSMMPLLRALSDVPEMEQRRVARRRRVIGGSVVVGFVTGLLTIVVYQGLALQRHEVTDEPQQAIEIANAEPKAVDPEPSIQRAMSLAARSDPLGAWSEFQRVEEQVSLDVDTILRFACMLLDRARILPSGPREKTLLTAHQVASLAEFKAEWAGDAAQLHSARSLLQVIEELS
jgi:serine/threonine protein kinase